MARVFNDWYLGLSGEEQRAFHAEQSEADDAGQEEWEAARDAEERARLELEPELPFPPQPERQSVTNRGDGFDADVPF